MTNLLIAETEYGKVQGVQKISALDVTYNAFLGIPYATPPVGSLRFKDPLPPSKWEGVYDANVEKSGCFEMNIMLKQVCGSEDSLYLNIFTKDLKPTKPLPVMVYLYGGAFQSGSSTLKMYSPDFLLMAEVIVVTLNYRVGALGFLSLKDEGLDVPGNAGLKDQRLALKFVKGNIQNFGGDPNNITLFGQSAGGASVSWHCASEGSKNLFNRAIIMSGCAMNNWALTPYRNWAYRLAKKLGYEGSEEDKAILEFLQQADAAKIVEVQKTLIETGERIGYSFAPHIEHFASERSFILKPAIEMQRMAWSNNIDILIGGVSDEGLMFLEEIRNNPKLFSYFKLESITPLEVGLSIDDPTAVAFVENMKKVYYPTSTEPSNDEMAFCKIKTDQTFWHGLQRTVQSRQNSGGSGKTFMYRFAVDSPTQNHYRNRRIGADVKGTCHADEISYLFKNSFGEVPERDTLEFRSIQRFVSLFTSFASTGNPNDNVIQADMQNVEVRPVVALEPPFEGICIEQDEVKFGTLPEFERLAIWDQLYRDSNTPLY